MMLRDGKSAHPISTLMRSNALQPRHNQIWVILQEVCNHSVIALVHGVCYDGGHQISKEVAPVVRDHFIRTSGLSTHQNGCVSAALRSAERYNRVSDHVCG